MFTAGALKSTVWKSGEMERFGAVFYACYWIPDLRSVVLVVVIV
jgi:hypothetical protein